MSGRPPRVRPDVSPLPLESEVVEDTGRRLANEKLLVSKGREQKCEKLTCDKIGRQARVLTNLSIGDSRDRAGSFSGMTLLTGLGLAETRYSYSVVLRVDNCTQLNTARFVYQLGSTRVFEWNCWSSSADTSGKRYSSYFVLFRNKTVKNVKQSSGARAVLSSDSPK